MPTTSALLGDLQLGAGQLGAAAPAEGPTVAVGHHTVALFTVNTAAGTATLLHAGAVFTTNTAGGSKQNVGSSAVFPAASSAGAATANASGVVFAARTGGGAWLDG